MPGESFLPALNGLYDHKNSIKIITCRHESGAANMAEAWGKLTGFPGIAFVTRGPGACHASIGIHTAMQDSSPNDSYLLDKLILGIREERLFRKSIILKCLGSTI